MKASPAPSDAAGPSSVPRSLTTIQDELARQDQALLDLSHASSVAVSLIECSKPSRQAKLIKHLGVRARERGYVTAQVSLEETSFDALEELVRTIIESLHAPGVARPGGLLQLLDAFLEKRGRRAVERFVEECDSAQAEGDLSELCRAYLSADGETQREVRAFEAWLDGAQPGRRSQNPNVRRALGAHTAQRALVHLSRIIRALGYSGLAVYLHNADALTRRTARQREKSYTVLRELLDNFDTGQGAVATRFLITGDRRLFYGDKSLATLPPLLARLEIPSSAEPPPPHRSWAKLVREPYEYIHRRVERQPQGRPAALRNLIRIAQGLPPLEAVRAMSVGHERIDRTISKLFEHADMAGSVFTTLVGDYGSGKTHLLMHLAERALSEKHPVFWLNLERMNLDLGNPAKHLARLLEHSVLPVRGRPSALERAHYFTRGPGRLRRLKEALVEVAATDSEAATAASRALYISEQAADPGHALERYLTAQDLVERSAAVGYRRDAYRRLLLWLELLAKLEGCAGPVVLIDEAENLYVSGASRAARRSSLRSLSFYCGGALPSACVVVAITPPALVELKKEARELLREVTEQQSTLDWEDATMFQRRLSRLEPEVVASFSRRQRLELAEQVRTAHRGVRGPVEVPDWDAMVRALTKEPLPPRTVIRTLVDQLEATWWAG